MKSLVIEYGRKSWDKIAEMMLELFSISRTGKQCRDRWINYANPDIKSNILLPEEEDMVFELVKIHGTR